MGLVDKEGWRPCWEEKFLDKVVYTKHCRCICEKNVKGHTAALGVLAMLKAAASRCKSPKEIPGAHMLLMASAHNPSSPTPAVSYWWMLAASFQSGQHDATQTFWRCHHVHDSIGPLSPRRHLRIERNEFFAMEKIARGRHSTSRPQLLLSTMRIRWRESWFVGPQQQG